MYKAACSKLDWGARPWFSDTRPRSPGLPWTHESSHSHPLSAKIAGVAHCTWLDNTHWDYCVRELSHVVLAGSFTIFSVLPQRKLRHREAKWFAQGHPATRWWGRWGDPDGLIPESTSWTTLKPACTELTFCPLTYLIQHTLILKNHISRMSLQLNKPPERWPSDHNQTLPVSNDLSLANYGAFHLVKSEAN